MRLVGLVARWSLILALAIATVLCILPLTARFSSHPGSGEDFILYRWAGISRTGSLRLGAFIILVVAITAGWMTGRTAFLSLARSMRVGRIAKGLYRYYRLEPGPTARAWPLRDTRVILACACALQAIYFLAIQLIFECDAATFYNFSKAILGIGGAFSASRPPGYPIFLILTGAIWPGTFIITLLTQAAMGLAIPVLVYRTLYGTGRWPALVAAFAVMVSTTPFTGAKFILSEQLFVFLTFLAIYYASRFHDDGDPRAIYAFALAGLGAMLTRWEAEFVLISGFGAILFLAIRRAHHLRHALLALAIVIVTLSGYSFARALLARDPSLIGTLQNGTGGQLFFRVYTMQAPPFMPESSREAASRGSWADGKTPLVQYVNPTNGPASVRLRNIVADFTRDQPADLQFLKQALPKLPRAKEAPPEGIYEFLFGRFENAPEALADNIFRSPSDWLTTQYVFYVVRAAQGELGLARGDRLLFSAALEAIYAHPETLYRMLADGMSLTGINLPDAVVLAHDPVSSGGWEKLFPYWDHFQYDRMEFDAGGCASNTLSAHLMKEYRFDQSIYNPSFATRAVAWGSFGRNLTRAVSGCVVLLGWWLLLLSPQRVIGFILAASLGAFISTTAIAVGGAYGKYEFTTLPLLVMTAAMIIAEAARRLRRILAPDVATV